MIADIKRNYDNFCNKMKEISLNYIKNILYANDYIFLEGDYNYDYDFTDLMLKTTFTDKVNAKNVIVVKVFIIQNFFVANDILLDININIYNIKKILFITLAENYKLLEIKKVLKTRGKKEDFVLINNKMSVYMKKKNNKIICYKYKDYHYNPINYYGVSYEIYIEHKNIQKFYKEDLSLDLSVVNKNLIFVYTYHDYNIYIEKILNNKVATKIIGYGLNKNILLFI